MNATAHIKDETTSLAGWIGPALLLGAALQFFLGNAVLADFPARPLNPIGDFGLLLVMTSPLTFTAGLGESLNWLIARFARKQ